MYAALLLALLAACAFSLPQPAFAKSYECSRVDIVAQVESNADFHVIEQRTFDFEGSFSAAWWSFPDLAEDAELVVYGVRMAQLDEQGNVVGDWLDLPQVSFVPSWRDEGGPGESAYAVDGAMDVVYAFFDWTDTTAVIELDYTIVGAVRAYEDVAELEWRFVPADWEVASENVTATIKLPVPAGDAVVPDYNVFAWGHGPADGQVKIGLDGSVVYQVSRIPSGQYSEARVLFPVEWLANASRELLAVHEGELLLQNAQSQESSWMDSSAAWWMNRWKALVLVTLFFGVLLLAGLVSYALFGRNRKPDFAGRYLSEIPAELADLHPAVLGRLWRWDRPNADDFVASILHLIRIGAIRVYEGTYVGPDGEEVRDCYLTVVEEVACECDDPVEKATLNMLFLHFGKGKPSVWSGSIRAFAQEDPREFSVLMKDWQHVLSLQTAKEEMFDSRSFKLQKAFALVALLALVAGLCAAVAMGTWEPALMGLASFAGLALVANYMPRRTQRGADLIARCKALKNWMRECGMVVGSAGASVVGTRGVAADADKDASASGCSRVPSNQMLVLAYVFELAEDETAAAFSAALKTAAKSADVELAKRGKAYNIEG